MKKEIKKTLIGTGIAAAAVAAAAGIYKLINDTLIGEAFDRKEPKIMEKAKGYIAGNSIDEDFMEKMRERGEKLKKEADETVTIKSFDGITLKAHIRRAENQKRIIIAMHGWRSSWIGDFGAIADFWYENGCTVLYAEQRGQGESEGEYMSFGILERYDCLSWVEWMNENGGKDVPLYIAGISMGATTVLMTAGFDLPSNVKGIIADCGFTSPDAIWRHITEDNLHISYDLRKKYIDMLCKKKFDFSSDSYSTLDAMKTNKVPVFFVHGTADSFVPVEMTYQNYEACTAPKRLVIVENAEHGMSYILEKERYEKEELDFFNTFDS